MPEANRKRLLPERALLAIACGVLGPDHHVAVGWLVVAQSKKANVDIWVAVPESIALKDSLSHPNARGLGIL